MYIVSVNMLFSVRSAILLWECRLLFSHS